MERCAFVADGAVGDEEAGQGKGGGDASGGSESDDEAHAGGGKLFGDEDGVRAADGAGDDAGAEARELGGVHACVETGPVGFFVDEVLLDEPVGEVAVEFEDAERGNWLAGETA